MNTQRLRYLNQYPEKPGRVIYWMSRDQRAAQNWSLIYAQELAQKHQRSLIVVFSLVESFLGAQDRQYYFMLEGLKETEKQLNSLGITFQLLIGDPVQTIPEYIEKQPTASLICDFSPLRIGRRWRQTIAERIPCSMIEIDSHNIIPAWQVSTKQEFSARTIRPKIHHLLPEYLDHFPKLKSIASPIKPETDWQTLYRRLNLKVQSTWIKPGPIAAQQQLNQFIADKLALYNQRRNDPNSSGQSYLSAYLHFGQISAQQIMLEVIKSHSIPLEILLKPQKTNDHNQHPAASFVEELVVRRELAENYCFYNQYYDSFTGFPQWAQTTLNKHRQDQRDFTYDLKTFETSQTHDRLWNACQQQMFSQGYLPGYVRMYWAKKILEWTQSPEEAIKIAIYLNDTYQLDGRDPNGYTGIAWSIGGVHDRPWFERAVYGMIRYMSYNGCRAKFDVDAYSKRWITL